MDRFFKEQSSRVLLYFAKETTTDPYRKTKEFSIVSSVPISAIVSDLNATQMQWKMPGISTGKAKQLIINKRDLESIRSSYKLKINNDYYEGWRVNSQLQYRETGEYVRLYVYIKKD